MTEEKTLDEKLQEDIVDRFVRLHTENLEYDIREIMDDVHEEGVEAGMDSMYEEIHKNIIAFRKILSKQASRLLGDYDKCFDLDSEELNKTELGDKTT